MSQISQLSEHGRTANPETSSIPVVEPASESSRAAKSSALMAAGTLLSRVLGLVRNILLVAAIGLTGAVADTFTVANNLPNYLYLMIAGGILNGVLIPQIIKASQRPDRGADYIGRLFSLLILILGIFTVLITSLAPVILHLTTHLRPEQIALATAFAFWCFPQIFFVGLYAFTGQVLNAHNAFGPYSWAPVLNNIIAILTLLLFLFLFGTASSSRPRTIENWSTVQTFVLAGGMTLGIALQALVLFVPLKKLNLGIKLKFGWRGIGLGKAAKIASFSIATVILGNLTYLVFTSLATRATAAVDASNTPIAGPSILENANMLYILPHSVIVISLATVLFNRLSLSFHHHDVAQVRSTLSYGLRTSAVATIFCAGVMIVLAGQIGMIFSVGNQVNAVILGQIVIVLALGAPLFGANYIMNRVFYAEEKAKIPFIIQVCLSVIMIFISLISLALPPQWIVMWIAITFTLSDVFVVILSHYFLKGRIGNYGAGHIVDVHIRICVAAVGSCIVGAPLLWLLGGTSFHGFAWSSVWGALISAVAVTVLMGVTYLLLLKVFRVRELRELLRPLIGRFH